jgi:hypothetical protein
MYCQRQELQQHYATAVAEKYVREFYNRTSVSECEIQRAGIQIATKISTLHLGKK